MMHPFKYIAVIALFFLTGCVNNNGVSKLPAKGSGLVNCTSPQLIPVYKEWVYDLNGYEGVSFGTAFNLLMRTPLSTPKEEMIIIHKQVLIPIQIQQNTSL
ncbi:MAG: hypothetical protein IPP79_08955 [Chitinophagaceae bacterium]|nr:hypothetical protein [Chitinophagaceae bacterium]